MQTHSMVHQHKQQTADHGGFCAELFASPLSSQAFRSKHIKGSNRMLFVRTKTQSANFLGHSLYQATKQFCWGGVLALKKKSTKKPSRTDSPKPFISLSPKVAEYLQMECRHLHMNCIQLLQTTRPILLNLLSWSRRVCTHACTHKNKVH